MQCGEDEHASEDGAEKDVMTVLRDDLHAALNATRIVQENMSAVQKKLRSAQFEHGPLNNSLRAALDELRTSQIAFGLLHKSFIEAQKASCEVN
jgi:glutamine synthetase